jgi:Asp-tRNA(Asn)/Glu-tRNA(Gln) amidotransferase A subunit family amidase
MGGSDWGDDDMADLLQLSAREAALRIAEGKLTAQDLVGACLERIAAREALVAAWAYLDPDQALTEARARDQVKPLGPLHGVPIGVKDVMDTADMPTSYGSRAYRGHQPRADAACVALARAAGAVILGKTVTTEFAAMSPGKTRHPFNPAHTPGGSSSGSAAAVAERMVPLAFGTQTAGSIIRPAAFCGVIGYKPSFGLVAIAGTKIFAPSLDTIGGFARDVTDIAWFIASLTGRPNLVPLEAASRPRIGVFRTEPWREAQPSTVAALEAAAAALARAGAVVAERGAFAPFAALVPAQQTIMAYEGVRSFAWERLQRANEIMPRTATLLADGAAVTAAAYDEALATVAAARAAAPEFFGDFDAVLVPSAPGEAPAVATTGDPVFNRAWTLLHLPCITLPAGHGPNGLPLGIQLVARARDDARLLAVARFAEAALRAAQ